MNTSSSLPVISNESYREIESSIESFMDRHTAEPLYLSDASVGSTTVDDIVPEDTIIGSITRVDLAPKLAFVDSTMIVELCDFPQSDDETMATINVEARTTVSNCKGLLDFIVEFKQVDDGVAVLSSRGIYIPHKANRPLAHTQLLAVIEKLGLKQDDVFREDMTMPYPYRDWSVDGAARFARMLKEL